MFTAADTAISVQTDPQVMLTELGDGTGVLLHLGTKFYYSLNRTGTLVWRTLDANQGCTIATLGSALSKVFKVAQADAERDVAAVLKTLLDEGLVRRAAG